VCNIGWLLAGPKVNKRTIENQGSGRRDERENDVRSFDLSLLRDRVDGSVCAPMINQSDTYRYADREWLSQARITRI